MKKKTKGKKKNKLKILRERKKERQNEINRICKKKGAGKKIG